MWPAVHLAVWQSVHAVWKNLRLIMQVNTSLFIHCLQRVHCLYLTYTESYWSIGLWLTPYNTCALYCAHVQYTCTSIQCTLYMEFCSCKYEYIFMSTKKSTRVRVWVLQHYSSMSMSTILLQYFFVLEYYNTATNLSVYSLWLIGIHLFVLIRC